MPGRFRGFAGSVSALGAWGICALAGCGAASSSEAELMLRAEDGPFAGTLTIESPHVGKHRVVLVLNEDAEGSAPLEGARVTLSPWMPAHGHGTEDVEVFEEEPGVYVTEDVWFNMPGIWDLRVRVEAEEYGDLIATVEVP